MEMKEQQEKEKNVPIIPPDLIEEILLRLPTKSLIRFRSLSKQCLSLTSDPNFINSNSNLCASTTNGILYITNSFEARWVDVDASSIRRFQTVRIPVPYHDKLTIIGSCRGFILIKNYPREPHFVLLNPLTGSHKTMPRNFCVIPWRTEIFHGFGYDESSDDYLMVVTRRVRRNSYDENGNLLWPPWQWEFFSVRNNSWENIAVNLPLGFEFVRRNGLFFNGAIHWFGIIDRSGSRHYAIVALELERKSMSEILLPDLGADSRLVNLIVFGGYLGLYSWKEHDLSIWVMKEYEVHSSWTIHYSIFHPFGLIDPMCVNKHGELVAIKDKKHLVKFDGKGRLVQRQQGNHLRQGTHMYEHDLFPLPTMEVVFTATLLSLPGHH